MVSDVTEIAEKGYNSHIPVYISPYRLNGPSMVLLNLLMVESRKREQRVYYSPKMAC